ncbi:hypothetical protein BDY17DRAFT_88644 [Neohortaea acidophila]|uniref:Alpha-1,3-mannosyltransferase n=1 Tax=Neohortaea acidophila TaxID=245834 RepID=A0A6A6Q3M8_9PEZI|nr:uncharacterized protein BDY17DRAFT_88644 [Neohortaea acidophila]KAF2486882.1 hypothetical protein BDY17DRAFT_88644 [Neohortaea acidophila]
MHILHPRSRGTSTLFTTTLAVSFLVVALPHLLPCPVDRRQFADSGENGTGRVKKRRVKQMDGVPERTVDENEGGRPRHECPIPKPTGLVGQLMGFERKESQKPVEVVVRGLTPSEARRGKERDGAP